MWVVQVSDGHMTTCLAEDLYRRYLAVVMSFVNPSVVLEFRLNLHNVKDRVESSLNPTSVIIQPLNFNLCNF